MERTQGAVYAGDSIGEKEVVELKPYSCTVVAKEIVEAIEIDKHVYRTVLWDLCDGEALPTHRIRYQYITCAFCMHAHTTSCTGRVVWRGAAKLAHNMEAQTTERSSYMCTAYNHACIMS